MESGEPGESMQEWLVLEEGSLFSFGTDDEKGGSSLEVLGEWTKRRGVYFSGREGDGVVGW